MSRRSILLGRERHSFDDLKAVMAAASPEKSGDRLAGIAADSNERRVAARYVLADIPLRSFLDEPLIPYETDEVTRLILDGHDAAAFAPVAHMTVGQFRDWLLSYDCTTEALTALAPTASSMLANKARSVAQSGYGRPNPGRDYLYVKASVSEPFGWVYGAASLAAMRNLNDGSWQLVPEISYTGFNNVELRARLIALGGRSHTEFGEKSLKTRLELTARLYF